MKENYINGLFISKRFLCYKYKFVVWDTIDLDGRDVCHMANKLAGSIKATWWIFLRAFLSKNKNKDFLES